MGYDENKNGKCPFNRDQQYTCDDDCALFINYTDNGENYEYCSFKLLALRINEIEMYIDDISENIASIEDTLRIKM